MSFLKIIKTQLKIIKELFIIYLLSLSIDNKDIMHMHKERSHKSKEKNPPIVFQRDNFGVMIQLVSHQIKIQFQLKSTLEFYDYSITQGTIESSPELSALYDSAESLFQDLKTSYNQIGFNEDGVIIFQLALQILGKSAKKQIKFYAKRRLSDSKIEELEAQIRRMAAQHLQQMEIIKTQYSHEINELRKEIFYIKSKLESYEQKGASNQGIQNGMNFTNLGIYDDNNANKKYFSVIKSENSIKVIKIVDSVIRNFALNLPIPKGSINTIFFKQTKTKNCSIKYGIITKALISSSNTYINKDSISLYGYNGHYATATKESWDGKAIKDGSIIAMTIDTFNWRLTWDVTGKSSDNFSVSTYIPEHMQTADLYVSMAIENEQDEVDISLEKSK